MGNNLSQIQTDVKNRLRNKLYFPGVENLKYSSDELVMTKASACAIGKHLTESKAQLTLAELLNIFHYQKQIVHKDFCALADVFYDEPAKSAKALDKELRDSPVGFREKYPLYGFVISIKDIIIYKDSDCTHGLVININRPAKFTPKLIQELENRGALVTAKGTVPQAVFSVENESNIFGCLTNPHNKARITGASTGGDSVLVAMGAVNACIGTDQGGSLRIPALFCGICSFKPTEGRYSDECTSGSFDFSDYYGKTGDVPDLIPQTIGPMANWVDDLIEIMKVFAANNAEYYNCYAIEWIQPRLPKKVGLIRDYSSLMEPCLTMQRALNECAQHLTALGCEVVPIDLNDIIRKITVNTLAFFFKGQQLRNIITGEIKIKEPLMPAFQNIKLLLKTPMPIVRMLRNSSMLSEREKLFIEAYIFSKDYNTGYMRARRRELIYEVTRRFTELGVETAVAPGLFPAPKVHSTKDNSLMCFQVFMWNYLNFPCGALPVTKVAEEEQVYQSVFADKITNSLADNMRESFGLPIGVQVVGVPKKDEFVLEVMRNLEAKIGYNKMTAI